MKYSKNMLDSMTADRNKTKKDGEVMDAKARIQRLELLLAEVEQLRNIEVEALKKKENKELKPYDWAGRDGVFFIDTQDGRVHLCNTEFADSLFYFDTEPEAQAFAHKLKIMSVMLNLKKALGDESVFVDGERNYTLVFFNNWDLHWSLNIENGSILFTQESAHKVKAYLNNHFPKGWAV